MKNIQAYFQDTSVQKVYFVQIIRIKTRIYTHFIKPVNTYIYIYIYIVMLYIYIYIYNVLGLKWLI